MTDAWLEQHLAKYALVLEAEEAEDKRFRATLKAVFGPVGETIYHEIADEPDEDARP